MTRDAEATIRRLAVIQRIERNPSVAAAVDDIRSDHYMTQMRDYGTELVEIRSYVKVVSFNKINSDVCVILII